jgi:membrane-associated protein
VGAIASGLIHLSGWVAYLLIAALVFGETAVFLGFVLPGEAAVVLGGVLASRGHVALAPLAATVVAAAVLGPLLGYEIGRRLGDRLFTVRALRRIPGGPERARSAIRDRGALAVLLGRFVVVIRAVMPAVAGAAGVRYRTFLFYDAAGGLVWGVGYCLLGYFAGSAYAAVEERVGTGIAIALAAGVVAATAAWALHRHRGVGRPGGQGQGAGQAGGQGQGAGQAGGPDLGGRHDRDARQPAGPDQGTGPDQGSRPDRGSGPDQGSGQGRDARQS